MQAGCRSAAYLEYKIIDKTTQTAAVEIQIEVCADYLAQHTTHCMQIV